MLGYLSLVASLLYLALVLLIRSYIRNAQQSNQRKRQRVLTELGVRDINEKRIVGFFHQY